MDTTLLEYKCPSCGGAIEFDPSLQKLKCPYCDTEFDVQTLKDYDETLNKEEDNMSWEQSAGAQWQEGEEGGLKVYVCKSCGGEIVGDETTSATSCPYCDNPVVFTGNLAGTLKPDLVIPFKLDKKAAKEGLKRHLKGKKLLPKVFKDENHIDEIKGVYVPFWLFDAEANGDVSFKGTKVRMWSDSNYNYTETSYYSVRRAGSMGFEKVPVDGSSKMADDLMESIEPYNYSEAVDFMTAYLAGYLADKYDVDAKQSINRANARIKKCTEDSLAATVRGGYNTLIPEGSSVQLKNSSYKYALLPVWILNTTWNGNKYTFAMNGQTGKFVGNLPMDKGAYWRYFFLAAGIVTAAVTGILCLINLL